MTSRVQGLTHRDRYYQGAPFIYQIALRGAFSCNDRTFGTSVTSRLLGLTQSPFYLPPA